MFKVTLLIKMIVKSPLIAFSHKYFQLTENCLFELINSKNKHSIWTDFDENITEEESYNLYIEKAKWSDFRIIEPLLFNFYHAIELVLKGILALNNEEFKTNHSLESLCNKAILHLEKAEKLKEILIKYCKLSNNESNNLLSIFYKENNLTPSKYYIILKYPFDSNNEYSYFKIHYLKDKGVDFAKELLEDIKTIKNQFRNL